MREVGLSARLKITVRGAVQGVGFRPFIYRLATGAGLKGWVNNSAQGVFIEVEGPRADLETFLLRLEAEKPPRSSIQSLEASWLDPVGYAGFEIRESEAAGPRPPWCCRTSPRAPIAWARSSTRSIAATGIRSPTAPTAARASASSNRSPMTARTPR